MDSRGRLSYKRLSQRTQVQSSRLGACPPETFYVLRLGFEPIKESGGTGVSPVRTITAGETPAPRTFHCLWVGLSPLSNCSKKFFRWHRLSSLCRPPGGRGRSPHPRISVCQRRLNLLEQ